MSDEHELLADNRELLARFRDGDRDALARVFDHYVHVVISTLRSGFMYTSKQQLTRFAGFSSSLDVEDALQEVFERAFSPRARLAYDGVRPYRRFLFGVTRNVVLDRLRRRARRYEVIEPVDIVETRAAGGDTAWAWAGPELAETLDERRARDLVQTFLATEGDDRDRRLYQLRYGDDLSQQECARQAGLTRIQVRRWEKKFRGRLLRYLKRANYVRDE